MNTLLFILLGFQTTVGLPEIIISLAGALILGITVHYFWNSRKSMNIEESANAQEGISENDNWKLKYYNDMDMQEKAQQQLRIRLSEAEENEQIQSIEVEELRKELKDLEYRAAVEPQVVPIAQKHTLDTGDYLSQLKSAQENLVGYNQQINRLLEQIQLLKESEKKYADLQQGYEQLNQENLDLRKSVSEKENEINQIRHQYRLTSEMTERLDKAYTEYNLLQDRLQKLESFLAQPQGKSIEYEGLQDSYFKLTKDFDEAKTKQTGLWEENQRLSRILADTEDKLKEANFQRQQLQKKTSFLEELNKDLQQVSEHNKKLESQLRRISEMESLMAKAIVPEKKY